MKTQLPKPKGAHSPAKPCRATKCPNKVKGRKTYCPKHQHLSTSNFRNKKGGTDPFYNSTRWRKTTKAYRKANPLCEHCEDRGKVTPAAMTDHITPIKDGGAKFDWDNLQALCHSCHSRKTLKENMTESTGITILSGPPGSGKTTYVKKNIKVGELVFDLDLIYQALTLQPAYVKPKQVENFAFRIRDKVYQLLKEPNDLKRAWVITTYAEADRRMRLANHLNAKSMIITPEPEVCKERIKKQQRKGHYNWNEIIDNWYDKFNQHKDEEVLS